jgi:hypothetical protein
LLQRLDDLLRSPFARRKDHHHDGSEQQHPVRRRQRVLLAVVAVLAVGGVADVMMPASAAVPAVNPTPGFSTQFDVTGFLQDAKLDCANYPSDSGDPARCGGTAQINGHNIVVPAETVVILPASALTWAELFTTAPTNYQANGQSGLALNDSPKPLTTYEVQMVGNRVRDANGDRYIAGMVHISQQDLNAGVGYINFIDYATGELEVGGTPGVKGTGTRVQINDPAAPGSGNGGRYGRAMTSDPRFQVDQDNPTILAETGFPMCIPRSDPTGPSPDALCPQSNRPNVSAPVVTDTSGITPQPNTLVAGQPYTLFRMDSPVNIDTNPALCLRTPCADPRLQAPFQIGDYINFNGNLVQDGGANGGEYISAHTIVASLGIYTQPGIDPAYVSVDVSLIGTGGLTVFGAGEAAVRTRFEGMTTDETRAIEVYGIDINPTTGATSDREWGMAIPDLGPPTGAVRGRWRFRPPCTSTIQTISPGKGCTPPPSGQFIPPTREVRAVVMPNPIPGANATAAAAAPLSQYKLGSIIANPTSQIPASGAGACTYALGVAVSHPCTTANGIFYGQYHAPIGEYIFPENVPGTAVPENNFNTIPFLANGGYQSLTGVQGGVLKPWPSNVAPPPLLCASPTIVGGPYSTNAGVAIQLSGAVTAGATTPVTIAWTAGTGAYGTPNEADMNGALTGASTTTPTFKTATPGVYNINLTVGNPCGVTTVSSKITVTNVAVAPTINPIQNQTVTAGSVVTINASSASLPAPTWVWTQTSGAAVVLTQQPSAATASANSSITFAAASAGVYTFSVTATSGGLSSPPVTVTITATSSVPVNVTLNNVYRTSKQRLVITATSTDPTVASMTLQPYQTETGSTFNPASLGSNLTVSLIAPGSFTITLVGAPGPACNLGGAYATPCKESPITVKSLNAVGTIIGSSPPSKLTTIRT